MDMVKPPFDEAFVVQNKEIPLKFVGNHSGSNGSNNNNLNNRLNRNQSTSEHSPSGSVHESNNQYHTLRYDFKPASVNCDEPAQLELTPSGQVTIKAPNVGGSSSNFTLFRGQRRPHIKECLLIIDNRTGEVVLQKLTDNITVKATRILNGTSGGGSSGNANGSNCGVGATVINTNSTAIPTTTSSSTSKSANNANNSFSSQNQVIPTNSTTNRSNSTNSSQNNSSYINNNSHTTSNSNLKQQADGPQLSEASSSSSDSGSDDGDSDDDSGSSSSGSSSSSSSSSDGSNSGNSSPNDDGFKF